MIITKTINNNDKINNYNFTQHNSNDVKFFDHSKFNISSRDIIKQNVNNTLDNREKMTKNI